MEAAFWAENRQSMYMYIWYIFGCFEVVRFLVMEDVGVLQYGLNMLPVDIMRFGAI